MFHLFRSVSRDAGGSEIRTVRRRRRTRLLRYIDILGPWAGVILFTIVMASQTPTFLTLPNIRNILVDASGYILLAVGMTFVITGAGIDLSVGSTLTLSGVALVMLVKHTSIDPILAMVVCLAVGTFLGLVNGLIITMLKMPDFIATLATMIAYRGITLVIVGGIVLYGFPKHMVYLGQARLWGIVPVSVIMAILVVAVADFLYKRTRFWQVYRGNRRESQCCHPRRDTLRQVQDIHLHLLRVPGCACGDHAYRKARFLSRHLRYGNGDAHDSSGHHRRHRPVRWDRAAVGLPGRCDIDLHGHQWDGAPQTSVLLAASRGGRSDNLGSYALHHHRPQGVAWSRGYGVSRKCVIGVYLGTMGTKTKLI